MILVTGTGRSGTSVVARVLHTRLGVDMGGPFDPPHPTWPDGNFEDQRYRDLHIRFNQGQMAEGELARELLRLSAERAEPWGVKDPRAAELLDVYIETFEGLDVVVCWRDPDAVMASMRRAWPWIPAAEVQHQVERRSALLTEFRGRPERPVILDMNRRWTDRELERVLADVLQLAPIR